MSSINVNGGAQVALQILTDRVREKEEVDEDVATGEEVAHAADNAAMWAISEMMGADIGAFEAQSQTLSLNEATVAVASAGAEQIQTALGEMQELIIAANTGTADYGMIEEQLQFKTDQINSIIGASQFNGANLLKTDVDGNGAGHLTTVMSLERSGNSDMTANYSGVRSADFEGNADFDINNRTAVTDAASAKTALEEIQGFMTYAIDTAANLGASQKALSDQNDFVNDLADEMVRGQSAIKDTDMEDAAARQSALGAQVSLAGTSLSIANANPSMLSRMF